MPRWFLILITFVVYIWLAFTVFMIAVTLSHPAVSKERFGVVHLRKGDVDVLARTLFGEARGEKRAGMEAVAWVILNRARRGPPRFQSTISEVCKAPYQFTCWSAKDPNSKICAAVHEGDPSFLLALNVATSVLGGLVPDPTRGSDHYHTVGMNPYPSWASKMQLQAVIGSHRFYAEKPAK